MPVELKKALEGIANPKNNNGRLMANCVTKYFEDIWRHVSDIGTVLAKKAEVHYVVGNSTFYGTLLPVEVIFKAMLQEVGFGDVQILTIRKRNSKSALFEFDVFGKCS